MRLFHYRPGTGEAPVPGLAETAARSGWRSAPEQPLPREVSRAIYEIACDMYGVPRGLTGQELGRGHGSPATFRDAYCFSDAGRTVTVANGRAILGADAQFLPGPPKDVAVCAIGLPAMLGPQWVYSRRYDLHPPMRATSAGNPAFDERYVVTSAPFTAGNAWLTPQVQQLVLAHDDWVLVALGPVLTCLTQGAFTTTDDVLRRVHEVLELVAAIPTSVVPDHADHSADDLAERMGRIRSLDQALAFFMGLSDADRERLARSDTPLADFADVHTPADAMLRLQSMDMNRRMQLFALFKR